MNIPWRTGLMVLALCGMCCSPSPNCTGDWYLGEIGSGGGSGSGVGGGISVPDGGGNTNTCSGTCAPLPEFPADDRSFVLLWLGPSGQEPDCPEGAPHPGLPTGFADLVAPPAACAPCTCQPPKGSCSLPTELAAYYSHPAECPAPLGTPFKPFAAPDGWEGSCTTYDAIPGDPTCSGSGCIQSLMIPPLGVTDPPTCKADLPPPPKVEPASWPSSARLCIGTTTGECWDHGKFCRAPGAEGFLECHAIEGAKVECPRKWTDKHIVYKYPTLEDTRACAECTCGAPVGSKCSSSVSVYTDDACGTLSPGASALLTLGVDSTGPACGTVPSGSALGSKKATHPEYQPGSCVPSGHPTHNDPIGEARGVDLGTGSVYTVCCKQNEVPR
jgi:hypothetical protein